MIVAAVRLAVEVVTICSLRVWLRSSESAPSLLLSMWKQWDANHYLELAKDGYQATGQAALNIAFLPLFPWAIRLMHLLVRDYLTAALLVSLLSSIAASYFLYLLVCQDLPEEAARNSVILFNVFPTAYFLIAPYTEGIFLAITFASLYLARTGRFAAASLLGSLCTATKVNGLILLPTLLLLYWRQAGAGFWSRRLLWCLIVPAGFLLYLAINFHLFGDPLHFMAVQRHHWHHSLRWPWQGMKDLLLSPFSLAPSHERVVIFDLGAGFLLLALAACFWSGARLPVAYTFQGVATLCLLLSASWNISLGRYVLSVVPLYFFLGAIAQRPLGRIVLLLFFLPLLGLLSSIFAAGRWAY